MPSKTKSKSKPSSTITKEKGKPSSMSPTPTKENEATPPPPSPRKPYRRFSAKEKVTAVLSLWSERRSTAEICRELDITYTMLQNWQETGLSAMLERLEPRVKDEETKPALNTKLAKLLAKKTRTSPSENGIKSLSGELQKHLSSVQEKMS